MIDLKSIFPKGARDFFSANAAIMEPSGKENALQVNVAPKKSKRWPLEEFDYEKRRGKMNKTEAEFAMRLEAMKRAGEILRFEFEGITLRWADMRYTPDFVVFWLSNDKTIPKSAQRIVIKLIEVKGAHIWDRDIVRFKGARAYWPEFQFEMWQRTKAKGWQRKY